jgi:hypothetical protein
MPKTDLAALNPEESEPKPPPAKPNQTQPTAESSQDKGENPALAAPDTTEAKSPTPDTGKGHLNPSAPEDANVTPGSTTPK